METVEDHEAERELVVRLESRDGETEIGWNLAAVAMLGGAEPTSEALWRVDPAPAPGGSLRVLSARFTDGRRLLLAGLRPRGTRDHGDELLAGALLAGAEVSALDEVLLSTEYDARGSARRVSLEAAFFEPEDDAGEPTGRLRVAGERRQAGLITAEDSIERVALDVRSTGIRGVGLLETLAPPR